MPLITAAIFLLIICAVLRIMPTGDQTESDRRPRRMGRPPVPKPPKSSRKSGKRSGVTWRRKGAGEKPY